MKPLRLIIGIVTFTLYTSLAVGQIPFQSDNNTYRITYTSSVNGKTSPNQNRIVVFTNARQTLITNEKDFKGEGKYPLEVSLVNRTNLSQQLYTLLDHANCIATIDSTAIKNQQIELQEGNKKILGYNCKKAKTVVNSNTIEFWYTSDLPVKGAPTVLGQNLGLVLEMIRNGNFVMSADEVKKTAYTNPSRFASIKPRLFDLLSYRDEIWRNRFTTIELFKDQLINFSDTATVKPDVMRFANGTIVVKKVKFPSLADAKTVFLDLQEQSNGDAYDRTGTVFLIPVDKKQSFLDGLKNGVSTLPVFENGNGKKYQGVAATVDYSPAIELMRFFTPFGIKQYNHIQLKGKDWHQVVPYRQDITAYASLLDGKEVYIGVFIGNYDKGGHKINAAITVHRGGDEPPKKVVSLFNTLNIMEMAGQEYATMFDKPEGLTVQFELNEAISSAVLRYTTTGHGGWGNGDEFVPKENTILFDEKTIFKMVPWREDCGSYRLFNPASGNFATGLSSSDLSRSNWCPGTVTNPFVVQLGNLSAGKHTIQVRIPQGAREGSSFSAWNVSGVIVGD
ncbi:PNGase F N-terminal domain-containing protein [Niabella yanshanensis]|uniref:PNGase F N-terminal domain-containing protein n=1 Tax=Niabella yanshanensis TaxID=577386 RepID=A0ABZ0WCQ5_9BACT|nr:PNGase F N-terminal domain-containing protein [Niabella yanshanensis]WQD40275.1 PNGase F N-terminal domain-containing protein [Niabella yanshanensis]